jgi:hypothetical protein
MEMKQDFSWNEKVSIFASQVLVALMMFCVGGTIAGLGERIVPGWNGGYLAWFGLLTAAEALFGQSRIKTMSRLSSDWVVFRISEIILFILVLRIFFTFRLEGGFTELLTQINENWFNGFFGGEFGLSLIFVLAIWLLSNRMGADLQDLEGDEFILKEGSHPGMFPDRIDIRKGMATNIFALGTFLIFIAVMARLNVPGIWGSRPVIEINAIYLLAYFVFGMMLLSLTQFAVLRASWGWRKMPISRDLAIAWIRYGLIFLLFVGIMINFLPTNYSLGLVTTFRIFFAILFNIVSFLVLLVIVPCMLLFSLFMGPGMRENIPPISQRFNQIIPPDVQETILVEPGDFFRNLFFWIAFLFIVGYAFVQFARQNEELWERLKRVPGAALIERFWKWLTSLFSKAKDGVENLVKTSLERIRERRASGKARNFWNTARLNQLPPREQVRVIYLNMVREATEEGIRRKDAETPREYAQTLEEEVPVVSPDVETLTDAFHEARYSEHDITAEEVGRLKDLWKNLKGRLKKGGSEVDR